MPLPSLAATSDNLIRDGLYIIALILADPETLSLAPTLEGAQNALELAIDEREAMDKVAIKASAVADFRLGAAQRGIVLFGARCYGHFGSRADVGYLRLFPHSPSDIAYITPGDRVNAFAALRKAAVDAATPKELASAVKVLVAALDDWTMAEAMAAKTTDGLKKASKQEADEADDWQTAVRKLRGQIISLFPRDVRRQRSYFPQKKANKKPNDPDSVG